MRCCLHASKNSESFVSVPYFRLISVSKMIILHRFYIPHRKFRKITTDNNRHDIFHIRVSVFVFLIRLELESVSVS